jgi:DNA polymerase III subunit epsilon
MPVKDTSEVVILDFETTGLSTHEERIIEVGAAVVKGNKITETFATLCNPGRYIPYFITDITGITNEMIKGQPKPEAVMPNLHKFIGERPILAHNASFDAQFLHSEMDRVNINIDNPFLCTMLLSRRLIQDAENHKLGTLKKHINFKGKKDHKDHRALDDVKVTVALWLHLKKLVSNMTGTKKLDISIYQKINKMPKKQVVARLEKIANT